MYISSISKYLSVALACFLGGVVFGTSIRKPAIVKTVELDRTKELNAKLDAISIRLDAYAARVRTFNGITDVVSVVETKPDGSVRRETRRISKQQSRETQQTQSAQQVTGLSQSVGQKERETRIVIEPILPDYRLSTDLGYSLPRLWGRREEWSLLKSRGLVAGFRAEKRIWGNVWGGIFANTAGVAGVAVSAEFQ